MLLAAVPAVVLLQEQHILGATAGAGHAVRPAPCYQILPAVGWIREIDDGVLKSGWFLSHAFILGQLAYFVK
jgi:hypothetical protein